MTQHRYAMATVGISACSTVAMIGAVVHLLSAEEQGVFFTLHSLASFISIADFGLVYASLQTAARLKGVGDGGALLSLRRLVFKWALALSFFAAVCVFYLGIRIIPTGNPAWHQVWMMLIPIVIASQISMPLIAWREGAGEIVQAWRLRAIVELASGMAVVATLWSGFGMYSLLAMWLVRSLLAASWAMLSPIKHEDEGEFSFLRWMDEVWPFQWRIGVSALSGYLIFRSFAPLVMMEQGPVLAGQFGIAVLLMNGIIAFSTAWPLSQTATYGAMFASGRGEEVSRMLPRLLFRSTGLCFFAVVIFSVFMFLLPAIDQKLSDRLLHPEVMTIMMLAAIVHHMVATMAVPLRAEGREPFMWVSLFGGILLSGAVWYAARYGTSIDIAWANLFCAAIGIPIAIILYRSRVTVWVRNRSFQHQR